MADFLFSGILLGLASGFAPGPLLTLVITETLQYDLQSGVRVALAPILTDVPIIAASFLLLKSVEQFDKALGLITFCGALFVLYLGFETFRTAKLQLQVGNGSSRSLRKAVIVNALSPHPYLFWATVGGPMLLQATESHFSLAWAFLTGFYGCLVGSKIVMAYLTARSRRFFQGRIYRLMLRSLGLLLIVFAVFLLRQGLDFFGL